MTSIKCYQSEAAQLLRNEILYKLLYNCTAFFKVGLCFNVVSGSLMYIKLHTNAAQKN